MKNYRELSSRMGRAGASEKAAAAIINELN
jgi:hypothetical protein